MKLQVFLSFIALAISLIIYSAFAEGLDDEKINMADLKQNLKEGLPFLAKKIGETTSQKCQNQLKVLQEIVMRDPERLMASRQDAVKTLCSVSRVCVGEIFKALDRFMVGGRDSLEKLFQEKAGMPLPDDMNLENFVFMYYDIVCKDVKRERGRMEEL